MNNKKDYTELIKELDEYKLTVRKLKENEERILSMVDASSDSIYLIDRDYRYLFVNNELLSRLGLPRKQVLGKTFVELHSPSPYEKEFVKMVDKVFKTGKPIKQVHKSKKLDRWFLRTINPVKNCNEGEITKAVVISKDITEQKREQFFIKTLMENIPESIYFKDKNSKFIRINRECAKKFGMENPEEAIGKTDFDIFSKEHAKQAYEDEQKVIKTNKPIVGIEEKETFKDEEDRWMSTTKMPWYDKERNIIGTFGISRDITEKKEAENELKKIHQELKETTAQIVHTERMAAVGELTAGVAHELNQPLNNIKIISQDLLRDINKNRLDINTLQQDLKDLVKLVNKMAEIIDHMRIFTRRLESLGREEININEPVNNMFMLLGEQLRVHNIDVKKNLAPNLPKILADATRLEQVFTNIMVNARNAVEDFRREGGRIDIKSFMNNKKEVSVSIKDNGGGIPLNIRDRIFEPFFTTKLVGKGVGLGLSIAKKIIEELNGRIELEVEEGEGCTFTVVIPIVEEKKGGN